MTAVVRMLPPDPVLSAQSAFRAVMNAMARPGTVHAVTGVEAAPAPMSSTAAAVARTLFDHDTTIWLDAALAGASDVAQWIRFHTAAPIVTKQDEAQFALVTDPENAPPFSTFNLGLPEYPDRSTTIILQVRSLEKGLPLSLEGPGIRGTRRLNVSPSHPDFAEQFAVNRGLFPRGVDLLLVADGAVAALPRSVRLSVERS